MPRPHAHWLLSIALLVAAAVAGHSPPEPFYVLVDSTVTIFRSKSAETVKIIGDSEPDNGKAQGNARDSSQLCPRPYRMTERDGCQLPRR